MGTKKLATLLREAASRAPEAALERAQEQAKEHVESILQICREQAKKAALDHGYTNTHVRISPPYTNGYLVTADEILDAVIDALRHEDGFKALYSHGVKDRTNIPEVTITVDWL